MGHQCIEIDGTSLGNPKKSIHIFFAESGHGCQELISWHLPCIPKGGVLNVHCQVFRRLPGIAASMIECGMSPLLLHTPNSQSIKVQNGGKRISPEQQILPLKIAMDKRLRIRGR